MRPEDQPPIKVGEIKAAIKKNKYAAENPSEVYGKSEGEWSVRNANVQHFNATFLETLPRPGEKGTEYFSKLEFISLKDYIETILSREKQSDLTAIEFGGPGSELFHGFSPGFFKQTIGVCLKDIRKEEKKKEDTVIKHSVLEGDIMDVLNDDLLNSVREKLNANKTDLIISRMAGPLNYIEKDPAILDRIIRNWYGLLNENGLMFIQFNHFFADKKLMPVIEKWAETVTKKFPEIEITVMNSKMRLYKRKGAPKELPNAYELFHK